MEKPNGIGAVGNARLFDVPCGILHSPLFMRKLAKIALTVALLGGTASAQQDGELVLKQPAGAAQPESSTNATPAAPQPPAGAVAISPEAGQPSPLVTPAENPNSPSIRPISMQEAIQSALTKNFDIQIERRNPLIRDYNLNASYAVYEPDIGLSGSHSFNTSPGGFDEFGTARDPSVSKRDSFGLNIGPNGYIPFTGGSYSLGSSLAHSQVRNQRENFSSGWVFEARQPLLRDLWIDSPRRTILLNKKLLEESEWALRLQMINTITQVEDAYFNLIFLREAVKVQRTALDLANRLLSDNKQRVAVGILARLDEKQSESEAARSVAALIEAEQNYAVQQNTLKNLITDDFRSVAAVTLDPVESLIAVPADTDLVESWRRGLAMRPDLQILRSELERNSIDLKFYKNQVFPALDLVGTLGQSDLQQGYSEAARGLTDLTNPRYSYGFQLSIPLGNTRARNNLKAAKEVKEQAVLRFKQLEQQILVQIDNAIKVLRTEFQRVDASRQARLFAQDAFDAEEKRLAAGKGTAFLVMQAQRDLTQRKFDEIQAIANYNRALSGLSQQTGLTLERHNLNFSR